MEGAVELADMIWQLRSELSRAMWGGEGKDLRFKAESVELELTIGVEKASEPGARLKFWIFDAGTSRRNTTMNTQLVRLRLHPVHANDPDRPALIGGDSLENED